MRLTMVATRLLRGRASGAFLTSGLASVSGLVVAVAVARTSTVSETGRFGIAVSAILLLGAVARSGAVDPVVVLARRPEDLRSLARASCIGLVGAVAVAVAAFALDSTWLAVSALASHGMVLRESIRAAQLARGSVSRVAVTEAVWAVSAVVASAGAITGLWSALSAFAAWSAAGAFLGYLSAALHRVDIVPSWRRSPVPTRRSASFMGDTLIGSGSVQASVWIATALGGLVIAGGVRGAGTLAGPVTVVLTAVRAVLIPRAVGHLSAPDGLSRLARDTVWMAVCVLPFLAFLAFLPDGVGAALLGDTWEVVAPVMPLVAMELLFQLIAAPAEAAHRVTASERRILSIRAVLATVRITTTLVAAPFGLGAVMVAALATTAVGAGTQWVSQAVLRGADQPCSDRTTPQHRDQDRINA